jgi:predicted ATPase
MMEAAAQFQMGLDQLILLPDDHERWRQELELRTALGVVWQAVKGFAAPEMGDTYTRARELWEQLGSPSEFLHLPYGQSRYHAYRGEYELAQRLDDDLLRLSRRRNDTAGLVLGHTSSGRNLLLAGRFASARSHLEAAVALYDPTGHLSLTHHAGFNPRILSQMYLGFVLFCLGFPDQALVQNNAAMAEARRLDHPMSLIGSLAGCIMLHALVGDSAAPDERIDELVAIATEKGFPIAYAFGTIHCGWAKLNNGEVAEGIWLLRGGLSAYRTTGATLWMPYHIGLLAMTCEMAGQIEEARTLSDEALQTVERTGERWFAAELNRCKGRLLLRQGHAAAAEELYRKALGIAAEQQAKLWELRVAISFARLRRDQGRRDEARDLLAPVHDWFTEGFDIPDLKDAKALLDELA